MMTKITTTEDADKMQSDEGHVIGEKRSKWSEQRAIIMSKP